MQDTSKMTPQELYAYRVQLYRDAIAFKKPDRIPINANMFTWMFLDAGYSPTKAARSYDLINDSMTQFVTKYKVDGINFLNSGYRNPFVISDSLGGSDVYTDQNAENLNVVVEDMMTPDEYEDLISDFPHFLYRKFLQKFPAAKEYTVDQLIESIRIQMEFFGNKAQSIMKMRNEYGITGELNFHYYMPAFEDLFSLYRGLKGVSMDLRRKKKDVERFIEHQNAQNKARIIEVFNASWPMYAAMPAILKDALEQVYISCGWDLLTSTCSHDAPVFPTFADLLDILPKVIKDAAYSQEVTSNYIGSLVTRVKSMTNGICGQIFCSQEIDNKKLFDENTIIDISRIGSGETKALIMGILIIRLQEHRSCKRTGINQDLRHVTLLEEAHHLLRATSGAQSMESANLRGMSVEILTNAIAEMRTYGEGFIIADQTPSIMSEAVISNTGSKVIFRLPNIKDRTPVSEAVSLNASQIEEIARLNTGVAVVHQSGWLNPVLCKIDLFPTEDFCPLDYSPDEVPKEFLLKARGVFLELLLCKRMNVEAPSKQFCADAMDVLSLSRDKNDKRISLYIKDYLSTGKMTAWDSFDEMCKIARTLFGADKLFNPFPNNAASWSKKAYQINRFAYEVRQNKKSLRAFSRQSSTSNSVNLLISGVEGIGLGLVGCGIPDIPLLTAVILRSLYEISTNYGYDYTKPEEQLYQLLIIQGAMSYGDNLKNCFDQLDAYTQAVVVPSEDAIKEQIKASASSLADEMLVLKFVQGIPIVGVIGGISDTVFLHRIQRFAKLNYQYRLLKQYSDNL